jgi:pimeloyl-ACP methyl ester carboxylesterase
MIIEKSFDTGSAIINYAVTESGQPPLVMLHGTANRWQAFLPMIPMLSNRWQIFAPDFRGHGRSQHTEKYGFGFYLEDTVKFLQGIVERPAVIFGHSLGGRVATKIAAEYPELVKSVILGDSSLKEPEPSNEMGKSFYRLVKIIEENRGYQKIYRAMQRENLDDFDPAYTLARAKNLSMLDSRLLITIAENGLDLKSLGNHFYGYHPEEHIKKIKCPVLILQAEHGMLSNIEVSRALETLPEAYHVLLKDVPHEFLYRPVEQLLKALYSFLEAVRD